jgi:hypothetical protein
VVNKIRQLVMFSVLSTSTQIVSGQSSALLFQTKEPLHLRADTKIKYIKKNLNDSIWGGVMGYELWVMSWGVGMGVCVL